MKQLLKYLKAYTRESILAPLLKLMEACMDLLVPLVVAGIINDGIAEEDSGIVVGNFLLLLALAVLGLLFSFSAQWMAAKASVGFSTSLRQALFDHVQRMSYADLDTQGTDTLITRMTSDVMQVQNGVNLTLRLLLRSPFIVLGAMVMAFTIDTKCALIFAAAIPVLSIVVFGIMLASIPKFSRAQQALDRLLGITRENLTGVRVIRAFCKEEKEIADFDAQSEALTRMNLRVGRLSALMNPATYVLINIAAILLIRQGAIEVHLGNLAQGDVVALYNYMAQIIVELVKLAMLIITINKSLACAGRIRDILAVVPGMEYPQPEAPANETADQAVSGVSAVSGAPIASGVSAVSGTPEASGGRSGPEDGSGDMIRFSHVSFAYKGYAQEAVMDIDFAVKKGQTLGIIGGTGSGKTTIANLIARFYDTSEGTVEIAGRNVREYPAGALVEQIGVVPQKAVLFEGTIRENLQWGKKNASDEEIWEAVRTAQAEDVVKGKEGALDARIEQNGRNFSGGQKQRLCIARALVKKPELLILDDSASALDFATDLRLRQALQHLDEDMTVVLISQRASSVRSADMILVLDDGRLAGRGTHEQLLAECPVYQEIYYSQYPDEKPDRKEAGA